MSRRDIREVLAQELTTTAAWKREAAAAQSGAHPPPHGASALDALARDIRSLPEDEPRLRALARLNRDPDFFLIGGERARELIDHYGKEAARGSDPEAAARAFLERLLDVSRADEDDAARRRDPPPPAR